MRGRLRLLLEPLPRGRFPREGRLRSLSWGSPRAPALSHSWRSGRVSAGSRPHGCAASGHEARPWCRDRHPSGKLGEARLRNDALSHRLEQLFLERPLHVPDLQSAWLLLLFCAAARANHLLRFLPPTASEEYAISRDAAVWQALRELLAQGRLSESAGPLAQRTRHLARLSGRMGGLGLTSAARSAHGAYWASWIDARPVMAAPAPEMVERIVGALRDAKA